LIVDWAPQSLATSRLPTARGRDGIVTTS